MAVKNGETGMFNVMLVDDEPIILSGLRGLINWEELGLAVTGTATNASDALKELERNHYDILLTDVRMSGQSGLVLIAEMRRRGYLTKIIIISGFDDFEYIKNAMHYQVENYIVKPIDEQELTDTLSNIITKIECEQSQTQVTRMMNAMLLDNVLAAWALKTLDDAALTERLRLFGINLDHHVYTLLTVRMYRMNPVNMSCEGIRSLFQNLCPQSVDIYATFNYTGDLLVVFAADDQPDINQVQHFIRNIVASWLGSVSHDWFTAVGEPVDHPMKLNQSYQSAMRLLLYHELTQDTKIMIHEIQQEKLAALCKYFEFEPEWVERFIEDDENTIQEKLSEMCRQLTKKISNPPYSLKECSELFLYGMLSRAKPIYDCILSNNPVPVNFNLLKNSCSATEYIQAIQSILADYAHAFPYDGVATHPLVTRVLKFIEESYNRELSLKSLACGFNVSQTYLGRIFKKETGKLFSDYLNDFRIERAKGLLTTTALHSNDVAGAVGFSNPNYFANVFKKRVGVYPTKYRQQNK